MFVWGQRYDVGEAARDQLVGLAAGVYAAIRRDDDAVGPIAARLDEGRPGLRFGELLSDSRFVSVD